MAEVNTGDGGGGKHAKKRAKRSSTRIDMTPMVDLAFLLLTFFVLTSTFAKPKTMEINYPAKLPPTMKPPKINNAITFLLTKDDGLYYYEGEFFADGIPNPKGEPNTVLKKVDYSAEGLHKLLLEKNDPTIKQINDLTAKLKSKEIVDSVYKKEVTKVKGDEKALTVLIKADDGAIYKNVIDIVDELNICNIGKYAVVDMGQKELDLLKATAK
ncbi:MAG: ExbD/TolR family protein [Bacteroidia bacterium]